MEFNYEVKPSFNLSGFLTAVRADGIKLEATDEDLTINGYITLSAGLLMVRLYAESIAEKNIVRLEGDLGDYKNTIDLKVSQYDA